MPRNKSKKMAGFTLLEIIIALFIFSIVSLIMVAALHNVIAIQAATEQKTTRLAELQIALLLISRDLEQTINRPVTNSAGKLEGFMGTPKSVTFTHAGLSNPLGQLNRTTLQRTRYEFTKNTLIRITWPVLDATSATPMDKRQLLDSVNELHFDYLDSKGHLQSIWPPLDQLNAILPRAVRISLTLANWGKITEIYLIAGQPLEKSN